MKINICKLLYTIFFVFFLESNLFSQNFNFGVKGGGNLSIQNLVIIEDGIRRKENINSRLLPYFGIWSEYLLSKSGKSKLQLEGNFISNGFKVISNKNDVYFYKQSFYQISFPLLWKFELIKNINISTGIYTSLLLNAKSKRKYEFNEKKEEYDITRINYNTKDYNLFDTGFLISVEYKLNSKFFLDIRYNHGFTFIQRSVHSSIPRNEAFLRNRSIQFGLGFVVN